MSAFRKTAFSMDVSRNAIFPNYVALTRFCWRSLASTHYRFILVGSSGNLVGSITLTTLRWVSHANYKTPERLLAISQKRTITIVFVISANDLELISVKFR